MNQFNEFIQALMRRNPTSILNHLERALEDLKQDRMLHNVKRLRQRYWVHYAVEGEQLSSDSARTMTSGYPEGSGPGRAFSIPRPVIRRKLTQTSDNETISVDIYGGASSFALEVTYDETKDSGTMTRKKRFEFRDKLPAIQEKSDDRKSQREKAAVANHPTSEDQTAATTALNVGKFSLPKASAKKAQQLLASQAEQAPNRNYEKSAAVAVRRHQVETIEHSVSVSVRSSIRWQLGNLLLGHIKILIENFSK